MSGLALRKSQKTVTTFLTKRRVRYSSSSPSLILRQDYPAPHCGSIRVLRLNNPKTRNAISRGLLAELKAHVHEIESEGSAGHTRALVLASNVDSAFCAGADLKERAQFTEKETFSFLEELRKTFHKVSLLPVPTITAVSAPALGGGLELALCSHFRVFASTATVALPESRLGIIPGAGGTHRLPALIGRTRALDMMLTGRRVAAAEAYYFGLCDRLIPVDPEDSNQSDSKQTPKEREAQLLSKANEAALSASIGLATEICRGGPIAIKKLVQLSSPGEECLETDQDRENQAYEGVIRTDDRNEALAAFREKRLPSFKGR